MLGEVDLSRVARVMVGIDLRSPISLWRVLFAERDVCSQS